MSGRHPQSGQQLPQPSAPQPSPQRAPERAPRRIGGEGGRRWKRIVAIALLLLLGGAVVNVAVAWTSAVYGTMDRSGTIHLPNQAERAIWRDPAPSIVTGEPALVVRSRSWGFAGMHMVGDRPPDSTLETSGDEEGIVADIQFSSHVGRPDVLDAVLVVNAGWPLPALEGRRWHLSIPVGWHFSETGFAIQQGERARSVSDFELPVNVNTAGAGESRMLPLLPLWWGFTINTLLYGMILWLLLFGPFAARRMLRRRRGLCAKCAYPIGASPVCTECGGRIPSLTGGAGVENRP